MKKIIFLLVLIAAIACAPPAETILNSRDAAVQEPVRVQPAETKVTPPQSKEPVMGEPTMADTSTQPDTPTTAVVGDACGGFAVAPCARTHQCIYDDGTTAPPHLNAKGTCQIIPPKKEVVVEAPYVPKNTHTITFALEPGPNFIAAGLRTSMMSTDFLSQATCTPTKVETNVLDERYGGFLYSGRITDEIEKSKPFPFSAKDYILLWCEKSGILSISGEPVSTYALVKGSNFVVSPDAETTGDDYLAGEKCSANVIYHNFVGAEDGAFKKYSPYKFLPGTHIPSRFVVPPNSPVLIQCTSSGTMTFQ